MNTTEIYARAAKRLGIDPENMTDQEREELEAEVDAVLEDDE